MKLRLTGTGPAGNEYHVSGVFGRTYHFRVGVVVEVPDEVGEYLLKKRPLDLTSSAPAPLPAVEPPKERPTRRRGPRRRMTKPHYGSEK